MSTQDFALHRASELVADDPGAAFDLILAADELDKTAAKDPMIVALNRGMRKIRTEGVKFLNAKAGDLVWKASDKIYDYIGLGSTVSFYGSPDANGRWAVRLQVDIGRRPAHQPPVGYDATIWVYGKGNRTIASFRSNEMTLDELKKSFGPKVLDKAVKAVNNHMSGSMDDEKARLLNYMDEALEAVKLAGPALKNARKKIQSTKNLIGDIDDIWAALRSIPSHDVESGVSNAIEFLREIKSAGG